MGLLDDAIREHLELKRRHGADPGAVARQESEALGPTTSPGDAAAAPQDDATAGHGGPAVAAGEAVSAVDVPVAPPDPSAGAIAAGEHMESAHGDAPFDHVDGEPAAAPFDHLESEPAAAASDVPVAASPTHEWDVESELRREEEEEARARAAEEEPRREPPPVAEHADEDAPPREPATFADPEDEPFADEPEPEPEPEDQEDVLEETPDFLAETPEHDRLWFEQKPPRDFDFDR
jgi:hypothetical protein